MVKAFMVFMLSLAVASAAMTRANRLKHVKQLNLAEEAIKPSLEELHSMTKEQLLDLYVKQNKLGETYWWRYNQTDCAYDDVTGSCDGQTVEQCKETCLKTSGCGGFNYPHGILKKTDCTSHLNSSPSVDLYVVKDTPQPPPPPPAVNFPPIWPMPAAFTNGSTTVVVDSVNFKFSATTTSKDLTAAFDRYQPLFFPNIANTPTGSNVVTGVEVTVEDVSGELQLETNESYILTIPDNGGMASITAPTVFGAMHGLETLSQLISFDFDAQSYKVAAAPWTINDKPRFAHREVLVDTARHFQALPALKAIVDSLVYAKINVVHWHLVDTQSFPFMSPTYPKLGSMGAWSSQERFTAADVAELVEYARQRGVRVMLEIDTPGHAGSWCKGHPEVCPSPTCTQPLNPATEATFDLLSGLFKDVTGGATGKGLFPDNMFHLGGDEVNTDCWTSTPSVAAWLKEQGLTADQGYAYFVNRTQAIAHSYGRQVVCWEEVWDHFGTQLKQDTIIHQWLPGSTIAVNATAHGYRVLWSTDGVWYLDGLKTTWKTMYAQEPCEGIPDNLCDTLVLGGGGEMWGETVDYSDWHQTVWPRLGAVAERLWSLRTVTDADAAHARMLAFRCLLNHRAVAAAPVDNPDARTSPPGPGSCYAQ
eukprot:m.274610 g.274610  ORF g.274610 m.274610 type:complete len:647 (+) comp17690_c0_seq3:36-1976(+)